MGISDVWKKHSGKMVAGLAITTAAYIIYKHIPTRETGSHKLARREFSQTKRRISDIEAQTFSEAFERCRRQKKCDDKEVKVETIEDRTTETSSCDTKLKHLEGDDVFTAPAAELATDGGEPCEDDDLSEGDSEDDDDDSDDEEDDSDDDEEDCESPLDAFGDVIKALDVSGLGQAALRIRKRQLKSGEDSSNTDAGSMSDLTYTMDGSPMCGAYNLVLRVDFSDGVKWVARIPGHGKRFEPADIMKMNSEYNTMRYIREHTSIPIPEVFYVMTSSAIAGVPFAFMSFVEGRALSDVWHQDLNGLQRLSMLSKIAENMVQLYQLKFDRIGMLEFDQAGQVTGVGPQISVLHEGDCAWARTLACVPFNNIDGYYSASYNQSDHEHIRVQAPIRILRIAVETMPAYLKNETKYPLTIADMNYQNIIIDEDYNITAFIDWDDVGSNASVNGCARYPSWITRDWDPAMHNYNPEAPLEGDSAEEHSPEELQKLRKHYAQAFTSHADELEDFDPRMTTLSHVVEAIELALSDSFIRPKIVMKMFDVAFDHVQPFKVFEYVNDVMAGDATEKDALIREAFTKAWVNEWKEVEVCSPEVSTRSSGLGSSYADLKVSPQGEQEEELGGSTCPAAFEKRELQSQGHLSMDNDEDDQEGDVQKDDAIDALKDGVEAGQEVVSDDSLDNSQMDNEEDNEEDNL